MTGPLHRTRRTSEISFPEFLDLGSTILRRQRVSDADAVFTRFLTFKTHRSVDEAVAFCALMEQRWDAGLEFTYAISEPEDASPYGAVSVRPDNFHVGFGYAMARDRWGRGHASRALKALVELALAQPGIWRAWAFCDAENPASARVMEKAGMIYEGRLRRWHVAPNVSPDPRDCLAYAKVR
ncbi:GCN5-related N-acetyltransferase [alpha proteobacterium BAL199]|jgi:[ribosomal protein S5]-alanine N-acetyltransferase|nr:GCN5-related N-acetyltransferase [alpha proteobacterium BAL199]